MRVRQWGARARRQALVALIMGVAPVLALSPGTAASATPDGLADLAVTVQAGGPAVPGTPLTWLLTVTNHGPAAAEGVTLTQTVPLGPGERITSAVSAVGPCSVHPPGSVACDLGQLDQDAAVRVVVIQDVSADRVAPPTTTAVAAANGADAASTDNTATATAGLRLIADLGVTGAVTVPDTLLGGPPIVTLLITNNGPGVVPVGTRASVTLPDPVRFVPTGSTPGCTAAGQVVTCALTKPLDVGPHDGTALVVQGSTAPPARSLRYPASVQPPAGVTDPEPGNDRVTVANEGTADADVGVSAAGPADPVVAGTTTSMTWTVTNRGPAGASGVTVSAALPDGVSFDSSSTGCTGSGSTVTCPTTPDLAAGNSVAQVVTVRVDAAHPAGTASVAVRVAVARPDDPNDADTVSYAPITVTRRANLALSASRDGPLDAGGPVSYELTVHNFGPASATGVVVTDRLPDEVVLGSASVPGGTCAVTGDLHTCTLSGPLAADASVVVRITGTVGAGVAGDTVTDSAFASSLDPEPDAGDNDAGSAGVVQGVLRESSTRAAVAESPVRRMLSVGGRLAWWSWAGGGTVLIGLVLLAVALRRMRAAPPPR